MMESFALGLILGMLIGFGFVMINDLRKARKEYYDIYKDKMK